jgi:hypothetical protein
MGFTNLISAEVVFFLTRYVCAFAGKLKVFATLDYIFIFLKTLDSLVVIPFVFCSV